VRGYKGKAVCVINSAFDGAGEVLLLLAKRHATQTGAQKNRRTPKRVGRMYNEDIPRTPDTPFTPD
jgi:hypothetical protein